MGAAIDKPRKPLVVRPIGRLHYLVQSRSRPDDCHIVDLEPIPGHGPYWCSCERHNENEHHHHTVCHHLIAAANYARRQYSRP